MTQLTHDPEVPFVFRHSTGDAPLAKFRRKVDADAFAENYGYGHVTDTTPKPPIPDNAEFVYWVNDAGQERYRTRFARRYGHPGNNVWQTDAGANITQEQLLINIDGSTIHVLREES
jgi:hypothetical protein